MSAGRLTLSQRINRRVGWYRARLMINNPVVGRAVELTGNKVRMEGMSFSVQTPNITRGHKSTLAFGLHEIEERALVRQWLPRSLPVIELGGGLGVVSCLANRLIADPDAHVVIEANPYMVPVLTRNRELNKCRFDIINHAIAYGTGKVDLPIDPSFVGSNLAAVGHSSELVSVAATTVTAVADQKSFDQFSLISDIEGAERDVILQDVPRLGDRLRFAMFELHPAILGDAVVAQLMWTMENCGFTLDQRMGEGEVFCVAYSRR